MWNDPDDISCHLCHFVTLHAVLSHFLWLKEGNIVVVIIKILFMYYIKEFCHSFHKDEPFENFQ